MRRIERFYDPYDVAIAQAISGLCGRPSAGHRHRPQLHALWRGWPRPWHVGILWDADGGSPGRCSTVSAEAGLVVGDNEPYDGALAGDTVDRHATRRGLANALIEIRQDLIAGRGRGGMGRAIRPAAWASSLARADLRCPRLRTRTRDRLRRH